MNLIILSIVFLVYFFVVGYVGYIAWKSTKSSDEFMVAGRKTHPYIMALSYGATFISTAAIVGFGGIAGQFGMSLLWLVFLNIFVGVFIAFVFMGKRTRKMGHNLGSLTFPEFLSRRFDSRFIQYFSGGIIFFGMPIYASVVLIGAARFMETSLSISFTLSLLILSVFVAFYVIFGGIRGVMYTEAVQGTIMFIGMIFLLIFTYWILGGVTESQTALTNLAPHFPASAQALGGTGWTTFPTLGSPFWWTLVSTIIMGVGIGVLAQPQLIVRFMTVQSDKELNRAVLMGGIFIAIITGSAFIVGSLSNVYFFNTLGQISVDVVGGNVDKIIPTFINLALPEWFVYIFLLTLLAAAMSTLSSQYHAQGTSLGRDIYETLKKKKNIESIPLTRIGILIAVILAFVLSLILPGSVVAQGTALFYGICAAAFLSVYICALFWKRTTREGAIAGIVSGTVTSLFWLIFVYGKTAEGLGICQFLTGQPMLIPTMPWPAIDALIVAVPISFIFTIVVSLLTKPMDQEQLDKCYRGFNSNKKIEGK
ncbi:sodium/solute symporter [Methanobrevibacter arboriphilus JCM 13429 = DSM 1125]|uniref:Sodium/solute symporter n=1 Tax=Methanobrevibacter arboriphilus JCM 13429 = DSM 1125 TaxID=1300164 RepID=A0A1V6N0M4_METAZ|nr:sodium:solute symporter family protein [Methanobrevibacter arboriphilus]OQD58239.1 sodium/solute symporter [Methanobrevibacter arboriphilus JCM 13429 = DSM 1125]